MNYTKLFEICWDDSYNDPDFSIPGTMAKWLKTRSPEDIERLAKNLEFLANALRTNTQPFGDARFSPIIDSDTKDTK